MRLIDADAFIEYLEDTDYSGAPDTLWEYTPQDITRMEIYEIKCQPTVDAVEVVRCKDCAFWKNNLTYQDRNGETWGDCLNLNKGPLTKGEFFCAWAERRKDETN